MNEKSKLILTQVCRFGAVTGPQLELLCHPHLRRATMYKRLRDFRNQKLVVATAFGTGSNVAYRTTESGTRLIQRDGHIMAREFRVKDIQHALQRTETLIELCHYASVCGVATEYEYSSHDLEGYLANRTPDALVCINQDGLVWELAVEVETSTKALDGTKEVIDLYAEAFQSKKQKCRVVIIVACTPLIYSRYEKAIGAVDEAVRKRFLLFPSPRLTGLKEGTFGKRLHGPDQSVDQLRTQSTAGIRYVPAMTRVDPTPKNGLIAHSSKFTDLMENP